MGSEVGMREKFLRSISFVGVTFAMELSSSSVGYGRPPRRSRKSEQGKETRPLTRRRRFSGQQVSGREEPSTTKSRRVRFLTKTRSPGTGLGDGVPAPLLELDLGA